ncbi:NB-ARC domain-containing protein [Nocardia heshunensis]
MKELLDTVTDWRALVLVLCVYGFAPGFLLRVVVLLYPREDARRRELIAELYVVPRWNRPFWVFEQLETALFEGIALRATATAAFLRRRHAGRKRTDYFRLPHGPTMTVPREAAMLSILRAAEPGRVVPVVTIQGVAGVGKTAFAVEAAHRLAPKFPDGQFYVKLQGSGPHSRASEIMDTLGGLLSGLGVKQRRVPRTLQGRQELWRKMLVDKRILLVLDDSGDGTYLDPLLPHEGHCMALVTSRAKAFEEGAAVVTLEVLTRASAIEMFCAHAGRAIDLEAARPTVAKIVELCGEIPLAISIAARCLAEHPSWTLDELADLLAAERYQAAGHSSTAGPVRAAFDLKYRQLSPLQQMIFLRLSLYSASVIDATFAARLADVSIDEAKQELKSLRAYGLLQEPDPSRYALHDLIRIYGHELAAIEPGI